MFCHSAKSPTLTTCSCGWLIWARSVYRAFSPYAKVSVAMKRNASSYLYSTQRSRLTPRSIYSPRSSISALWTSSLTIKLVESSQACSDQLITRSCRQAGATLQAAMKTKRSTVKCRTSCCLIRQVAHPHKSSMMSSRKNLRSSRLSSKIKKLNVTPLTTFRINKRRKWWQPLF